MISMSNDPPGPRPESRPPAAAGAVATSRGGLARRLVPVVVVGVIVNTTIAALLTMALRGPGHNFAGHFVYSQFIGLSILLLVVLPRLALWPRETLAPWQKALHLAVATVFGFIGGSFGASLVLGTPPLVRARESDDNVLLMVLLITVLASVGCSSFFWLRERVASLRVEASGERARAEAERARAEAASRQATEAQLNLIRTQLEPHMLFNTLANLRSLMTIDPPRAQFMVDRLIAFLRATLAASRHDEVTLREEFDLLRDYLELMAIRMGPRLAFSLQLPAELAAVRVLPLLLQPLVENAVRHGLEPAINGGRIIVSASADGEHLTLVVEDSGIGFPHHEGPEPCREKMGFGLAQIRERLATAYGEAAGIRIDRRHPPALEDPPTSAEEAGTRVTLRLPMPMPMPMRDSMPVSTPVSMPVSSSVPAATTGSNRDAK